MRALTRARRTERAFVYLLVCTRMSTRDRLVESTQELLWDFGYVATSPKAIQRRAEAGQGSMYHHFEGKPDLARAAITRTAQEMCAVADAELSGPGTPVERLTAYLGRERDVLRGCRLGRLAADPEVVASPALRAPLEETFAWLHGRVAEVLAEGQAAGELDGAHDPADLSAALLAVLQGGYVLARCAADPDPFDRAVRGALALLTPTRGGA